MKKERKDKHFIKKPFYEGGLKAMREFISQHKKYPKEALEQKIEGTVYLRYTINYKGKVIDAKVLSSLGYGCDKEAIRVVKLLKFKVQKNYAGKIKFFKTIQMHFKLPKEKESPKVTNQINYNITPSASKEPKKKDNQGGYSYTIKY